MKRVVLISILTLLISCGPSTEETTPIRKNVTEMVFASGVLEAANTYDITAQTEGFLMNVYFKEGDVLDAGTVLAEVANDENAFRYESDNQLYRISQRNLQPNSPAISQARNDMISAQIQYYSDSVQATRYENLYRSRAVSQVDLESYQLRYQSSRLALLSAQEKLRLTIQEAEQKLIADRASKKISRENLGNNKIRLLVPGKVYKKHKETGDYVRRGDVLATIGDAQIIYAKVNVDESTIARVAVGQQAVIQLNTNQSKVYKARVREIYPAFDEASQSFICKLEFLDSLDFRITGTQLQSNIVVKKEDHALLIPRNYLNYDGTVTLSASQTSVPVETRFIGSAWVHVTSGLDDKTKIITTNIAANKVDPSELGSQMR
jgi:multidrug efflux pump subunit AcrA (membrane-fusion protein)